MPSKSKAKFKQLARSKRLATDTSIVTETIKRVGTDVDYTETFKNGKAVLHTGTLTADRTITLPTGEDNAKMYFTRTGAGAFNLNIGALKALPTNSWCVIRYDATFASWFLFQYGTL